MLNTPETQDKTRNARLEARVSIASRGFRPPTHQVVSKVNRLLRIVPPVALGADFFSCLSWALDKAPSSAAY
jgi:hypothetical protein